jgi:hypothetical protein
MPVVRTSSLGRWPIAEFAPHASAVRLATASIDLTNSESSRWFRVLSLGQSHFVLPARLVRLKRRTVMDVPEWQTAKV